MTQAASWIPSYPSFTSDAVITNQNYSILIKGPYSQSYNFSSNHVRMWELDHKEEWMPKNSCFQIVVLERLLRVPWTARRSNQLTLKEINPEYSLKGLLLKLRHQYFGHLNWRADSLEKTLMLGKIDWRAKEKGEMRWLDSTTDSMDVNLSKLQERAEDRKAWRATVHGFTKELDMT